MNVKTRLKQLEKYICPSKREFVVLHIRDRKDPNEYNKTINILEKQYVGEGGNPKATFVVIRKYGNDKDEISTTFFGES